MRIKPFAIYNRNRNTSESLEDMDDYEFKINSFMLRPYRWGIIYKDLWDVENFYKVNEPDYLAVEVNLGDKVIFIKSFLEARKLLGNVRQLRLEELDKLEKYTGKLDNKDELVTDGKWIWRLGKLRDGFWKYSELDKSS